MATATSPSSSPDLGNLADRKYHIATAPPLSEPTAAAKAFTVAGGIILGIANPKAWVGDFRVFASTHFADAATTLRPRS